MNLDGGLILGVNTLYRLFCFFKLFLMVGKGLTSTRFLSSCSLIIQTLQLEDLRLASYLRVEGPGYKATLSPL